MTRWGVLVVASCVVVLAACGDSERPVAPPEELPTSECDSGEPSATPPWELPPDPTRCAYAEEWATRAKDPAVADRRIWELEQELERLRSAPLDPTDAEAVAARETRIRALWERLLLTPPPPPR